MAKKKRKPPPETGMDRLKKMPLWQWGLIVIFGGLVSNLLMMTVASSGASSAARRGEAVGRGVATALFVLIGLGLVIAHFIKKKRQN